MFVKFTNISLDIRSYSTILQNRKQHAIRDEILETMITHEKTFLHIHYYCSLLNIELLLSHCQINGFLLLPVSVPVTLFSHRIM